MKIYTTEYKNTFYGLEYRFVSLYNGMRGTWGTKELAEAQGEFHQEIIKMVTGWETVYDARKDAVDALGD